MDELEQAYRTVARECGMKLSRPQFWRLVQAGVSVEEFRRRLVIDALVRRVYIPALFVEMSEPEAADFAAWEAELDPDGHGRV